MKVKTTVSGPSATAKQDEITAQAREIAASHRAGDTLISMTVSAMQEAHKAKNFSRADAIRAQLNEEGIIVEMTKDGARWRRK